jgi:hypothetical protein
VRRRAAGTALLLVGLLVVATGAASGATAVSAGPPRVGLDLAANGSLSISVAFTLVNGSALRYAMDGNFTPLVSALPLNATSRATVLADIDAAESSLLLAGLFGNHDGTVETFEVHDFESLIETAAARLPAGFGSGLAPVTLAVDGETVTAMQLQSVAFSGAEAPVTSNAPIDVETVAGAAVSLQGTQHTVSLSVSSTLASVLALTVPPIEFALTTPPGDAVTGVAGLESPAITNDFWGLGSGSVQGTLSPSGNGAVVVHFGPAFPTAYVVAAGVAAAAVAVAVVLLLRRKRRAARAGPGVGSAAPEETPPESETEEASVRSGSA